MPMNSSKGNFRPTANEVAVIMRKSETTHRHSASLGVAAVLIFAAAAGFAIWWTMIRSTSESTPPTKSQGAGAVAVSAGGLEILAGLGRPIYWAGPKSGFTYELTQAADGRMYLRYLPAGTPAGSPKIFLTVATYPIADAFSVTKRVATQSGSVTVPVEGGGIAVYHSRLPTNVYVAFPGSGYQVEVFDPSPAQARALVTGGSISQVPSAAAGAAVPKTAAVAATPNALAKLAAKLGRPLYWAGKEAGVTYELTQTPDGRVYVRYLPAGAKVGSDKPYLTVGTYPVRNAYTTTMAAAKQPGSTLIPVPGGVAFYNKSRPTSVYVAFPGIDEQIEVYDPSVSAVRATVAQHLVHSIS
jgi:hypothetical protein